jgi:acyl-CoA thioesterase-1
MEAPTNAGPEYRREVHEAYEQLEKEYDVVFIPFVLKDLAGSEKLLQPDGTHPTAEGARLIAETVYKHVKPLLSFSAASH